jgi:hypothetical protein
MTDLELNKALAKAIGWREDQIRTYPRTGNVYVDYGNDGKLFDHADWRVAGPIAERFDCFPCFYQGQREAGVPPYGSADTPQRAIALAVIQGVGK